MNSFDSKGTKRISFILATKNRARFLEKSLKSHRELIGPRDELIIIDGKSSDNTAAVVAKNSDIVDIFVSEEDISEGNATNKGTLLARGKYVKLLTDDDFFYKDAIEKAYRVMEKNPQIDVLLCGGVKKRGEEIGYVFVPKGVEYGAGIANIFKYGGCGLGLLIRRSAFSSIGLFNSRALSMDVDFLAQAIATGAIVKFCRLKMYTHNIEAHSASVTNLSKLNRDFDRIKREHELGKDLFWVDLKNKINGVFYTIVPKNLILFLLKLLGRKMKESIEPVWDGGFS